MKDFVLPHVSIFIVKLKQMDEMRDLRHSFTIKNVKIIKINANPKHNFK